MKLLLSVVAIVLLTVNFWSNYCSVVSDIKPDMVTGVASNGDVIFSVNVTFNPGVYSFDVKNTTNNNLIIDVLADEYIDYDFEDYDGEYNEEKEGCSP